MITRAVLMAMLLASLPAAAATGPERLSAFLSGLTTLSADFAQTVFDEQQHPLEKSSGNMMLRRPDRFRWEYRTPYRQTIVSDGKHVWVYDHDLAQVTVQSLEKTIGNTPALLLSSDRKIEDDFVVHDLGVREGLTWAGLVPRAKDATFSAIRVAFDDAGLARMELVDAFGHLTRIVFSNVKRNPTLDANAFEFTPPAGVDVIEGRH